MLKTINKNNNNNNNNSYNNNNIYWPLHERGLGSIKQIVNKQQVFKNPNWQEADQLTDCKVRPRSWTQGNREQIQCIAGWRANKSGALATRPHCSLITEGSIWEQWQAANHLHIYHSPNVHEYQQLFSHLKKQD